MTVKLLTKHPLEFLSHRLIWVHTCQNATFLKSHVTAYLWFSCGILYFFIIKEIFCEQTVKTHSAASDLCLYWLPTSHNLRTSRSHCGVVDKPRTLYTRRWVQSPASPVCPMRFYAVAHSPYDLGCLWDVKHKHTHTLGMSRVIFIKLAKWW